MTVKCGNKRKHGQHSVIYHNSAKDVKACFEGRDVAHVSGVTVPAGTARDRRYRRSVDAAWVEFAMVNENWDGESHLIRGAKKDFYQQRGIMLTEEELELP